MRNISTEKMTQRLKDLIQEFETSQEGQTSGYYYEKTYVEMMRKFEAELLQELVGVPPKDKNLKKK